MASRSRSRKASDTHLARVIIATDLRLMCVIRAMLLAALVAFLWAAQIGDQGPGIDPDGSAKTAAGVRIDDNG